MSLGLSLSADLLPVSLSVVVAVAVAEAVVDGRRCGGGPNGLKPPIFNFAVISETFLSSEVLVGFGSEFALVGSVEIEFEAALLSVSTFVPTSNIPPPGSPFKAAILSAILPFRTAVVVGFDSMFATGVEGTASFAIDSGEPDDGDDAFSAAILSAIEEVFATFSSLDECVLLLTIVLCDIDPAPNITLFGRESLTGVLFESEPSKEAEFSKEAFKFASLSATTEVLLGRVVVVVAVAVAVGEGVDLRRAILSFTDKGVDESDINFENL